MLNICHIIRVKYKIEHMFITYNSNNFKKVELSLLQKGSVWQMKERVIFHCDANSFFASVEIAQDESLKGKAVAVSGNPATRTGIILTKNEVAKKFGVLTGEAIWQAKQKCPDLVCLPPHHKLYEEYSKKLRAIYEKYTDRVEAFGIDECWLDVTDSLKFFGSKEFLANKIREEVKSMLNITISVGVSFGKLFAKLGSDLKKPDAVTVISQENFKNIIYPLPINAIIGIGKRLELRFKKLGVNRLGDVITLPDFILKKKFGVIGLNLKQKLLGNDFEEVRKCNDFVAPKSVGNGTTTITDVYSREQIKAVVSALCDEVCCRLRDGGFNASSLSVTLKTADFKYYHQTTRLDYCSCYSTDFVSAVMKMLDRDWNFSCAVRAIRICSYNLSSAKKTQLSMFSNEIKNYNLNSTIDQIRHKYGYFSVMPASTLKNPHLDLQKVEV